ncbi:isoprenoid synthase domain-containing protein [Thamnocephalis sphaerospora]|uniref:Isoprenoid synthase domain-containing protein n=1 Tax=Thamnocephalis sphaerospora TaxID=78915 RepID=A0A4P9XV67_9FUNG|nr:isoprenoid synthase domain-containing protein [Thamnocephalis sphaerospora]|eukprot:RKP09300.1 isoprenoid synthase domain-containing protein [Thamnocephalis sphaerospora]
MFARANNAVRIAAVFRPRAQVAIAGQPVWRACAYSTAPASAADTATAAKSPLSAIQYCRDLVRKYDHEHYLCGLLYPAHLRNGYWALRAFFIELSAVREAVSDPRIGQMRLQFWRDAVDSTFKGHPPQHPVTVALSQTVLAHSTGEGAVRPLVSSSWMKRIINEREKDMEDPYHATMESLEAYVEAAHASAMYLQLELLGVRSVSADHIASHIGKAYGLVTLLRATPFHASKRRTYLPAALLAEHGVSQEDLFRNGPTAEGLHDVVYDVASVAHRHLEVAKDHWVDDRHRKDVPSHAFTAMLAAIPARTYLDRLQQVHFNVFDPKLTVRPWKLPWTLYMANRRRKFS